MPVCLALPHWFYHSFRQNYLGASLDIGLTDYGDVSYPRTYRKYFWKFFASCKKYDCVVKPLDLIIKLLRSH
jgi:hypothetical protein